MSKRFNVSPSEYEVLVKKLLTKQGKKLENIKLTHKEILAGPDGEYEIDVVAKFNAFKVDFLVLAECKHHKNPIKRELVQALKAKRDSLSAQKAIMFSTVDFQSGALEYAQKNGIALILFRDGKSIELAKSMDFEEDRYQEKSYAFIKAEYIENHDFPSETLIYSSADDIGLGNLFE